MRAVILERSTEMAEKNSVSVGWVQWEKKQDAVSKDHVSKIATTVQKRAPLSTGMRMAVKR